MSTKDQRDMKSYCMRRELLIDAEGFAGFLIENHPDIYDEIVRLGAPQVEALVEAHLHTADSPKVPSTVTRGCDARPRLNVRGQS